MFSANSSKLVWPNQFYFSMFFLTEVIWLTDTGEDSKLGQKRMRSKPNTTVTIAKFALERHHSTVFFFGHIACIGLASTVNIFETQYCFQFRIYLMSHWNSKNPGYQIIKKKKFTWNIFLRKLKFVRSKKLQLRSIGVISFKKRINHAYDK